MMNLKKRDIPDNSRPLALQNFLNSLGDLRAGQQAMNALGCEYLKGNDYFGVTKHIHFQRRVLKALECIQDKGLKEIMARDYKNIVMERIKKSWCPAFIEGRLIKVVVINHKNFIKNIKQ